MGELKVGNLSPEEMLVMFQKKAIAMELAEAKEAERISAREILSRPRPMAMTGEWYKYFEARKRVDDLTMI